MSKEDKTFKKFVKLQADINKAEKSTSRSAKKSAKKNMDNQLNEISLRTAKALAHAK